MPTGSWSKWVQAAYTALPASWELTVSVTTSDGQALETSTSSGSGEGSVYEAQADNGGGTFPTDLITKVESLAGI